MMSQDINKKLFSALRIKIHWIKSGSMPFVNEDLDRSAVTQKENWEKGEDIF